jgi:hypothetical protein
VAVLERLSIDSWALEGRRGWDANVPLAPIDLDPEARTVLRAQELDRLELRLTPGDGEAVTGYLRVRGRLRPLPVGASLDEGTGVFTWAPGAGFIGRYDLVFVRTVDGTPVGRRDVRVVIGPKR